MTMREALQKLNVEALGEDEKQSLDRDGFLIVPDAIEPELAARMAARLDELAREEGELAGTDFHTEAGATRLGTLVNKDAMFDICFTHPRALAAVRHIMGDDFGLSSSTGRAAQPGEGHQGLHRDSPNAERSANVLWMLSDFTENNGPTWLIPGSYRAPGAPFELLEDAAAAHPDEIRLRAPRGSCVIINGWTWHDGTRNNSVQPRHLLSAFFTQRGVYQSIAQRRLTPDAAQRLSPAAQFVFDSA